MKKITPYLFGIAAAGVTIMVAGTASVLILPEGNHAPVVTASSPQQADLMAQTVMQAKCAACHGENPTYNSFVNFFAFGQLRRDVENAQKAFTMAGNSDIRSGAVDYLKMDRVLRTRKMPPARYSAVHFGTGLTPADVAVLRTRYTQDGALKRMFSPISSNVKPLQGCCTAPRTPIQNALREGSLLFGENPLKLRLGHLLYFDTRLSTTNSVSCASCHDLTLGGTDNKTKSEGVPGADGLPQLGGVNAPSVYNAAGNIRQFWDGRAANLAEQAGGPPLNPVEMGYESPADWAKIAEKLAQDPELAYLFKAVYGTEGITGETITDAIAAFEKCLVTPDSAFDLFLKGDEAALTDEQKQGMMHYINYGCVTCHAGSTLGGISFEHINTHADLRQHAENYEETAHGLTDYTKEAKHGDMFRVPNLRNVALTAPYFHTGTVSTLDEAVRIMFQTEVGTEPSNSMVKSVTAFLQAQTGKLGGKPLDMLTPEDVAPAPAPGSARRTPAKPPVHAAPALRPMPVEMAPDAEPAAVVAPATVVVPAAVDTPAPEVSEPITEQSGEDAPACGCADGCPAKNTAE